MTTFEVVNTSEFAPRDVMTHGLSDCDFPC
jgi:hypothetical protein